jgi:hypothetical protein
LHFDDVRVVAMLLRTDFDHAATRVLLFAAKDLSFAASGSGGRTQSLARESNSLAADTKTLAICMRENY